jgi:DNA-binding MarR family transcriptional regulator
VSPSDDPLHSAAFEAALAAHSAGDSPGFMLWHATLGWQRRVAAVLAELDLTYAQFGLLATTWWLGRTSEEPPSQRRVAAHAGIGEVMTSQVLKLLERKELVTRERSERDVRMRCLRLTPAGLALTERAVVAVDAAERDFFAPVADPKALVAALRELGGRTEAGDAAEDRA